MDKHNSGLFNGAAVFLDGTSMKMFEAYPLRPTDKWLVYTVKSTGNSVVCSEQVLDYEIEFNAKDGKTVFLSVSAQKILDEDDRPIAIEGSARNTTERRLAEDNLIHELKYEKAISSMSAAFIAPDNFDTALDSALASISQLSKAARCYLFILSDDKKLISNTNESVGSGVGVKKPALQNMSTRRFEWALAKLAKGEQIKLDDVPQSSQEAHQMVAELNRDDVGSLLLAPINAGEELAGFISIDMIGHKTFIPDQARILLKISADIIGDAFDRYKHDQYDQHFHYSGPSDKLSIWKDKK